MKYLKTLAAATFLIALPAAAHDDEPRQKANLPETEIFLFDLEMGDTLTISNARNVTTRTGYDNQPRFTPDSASFLYARGDDYQTDIWEYDLSSGTTQQITQTETNEFSPVASPDNQTISYVNDGPGAAQNVMYIRRDASEIEIKLLPAAALREPVGYYSWNPQTDDVLFWSRYGFNITLARKDAAQTTYISGDAVPSTPYVIPNSTHKFSFVHRQGNGQVWIKELDPATKSVRPLTPIKGSNANYGWTPDGAILIIEDDVLYHWREGNNEGWVKVADLSEFNITDANRLAVSPDGTKLAVVGLPSTL